MLRKPPHIEHIPRPTALFDHNDRLRGPVGQESSVNSKTVIVSMVRVRRSLFSYVTVASRVYARMVRDHVPAIIAASIHIGGDNRREL